MYQPAIVRGKQQCGCADCRSIHPSIAKTIFFLPEILIDQDIPENISVIISVALPGEIDLENFTTIVFRYGSDNIGL